MKLFRNLALMLGVSLLGASLLIGPALAGGGGNDKKCGVDYPSGSYTKSCDHPYWSNNEHMRAFCRKPGIKGSINTGISCRTIKHCDWKLAYRDGMVVCD